MGYKMKRGSSPNFKELGSSLPQAGDSPTKASVAGGAVGGLGPGAAIGAGVGALFGGVGAVPGAIIGGGIGALTGGISQKIEKQKEYKQYKDQLEAEGLGKNFWGKLGFGGGNKVAREMRIAELQAADQEGLDRDRIESRTGGTAGPA